MAAVLTALTLFAFAGYQVTSEAAATKLLGRLAAALVELDRWVPTHREDIELVARDRPQEAVLVDDLPVDVLIPSQVALQAGDEDLRNHLRAAMGRRLYDEGSAILQDEEGESHLPVTEPVRWSVWLLGSGMHAFWSVALILGVVVTLVLGVRLWMTRQSPLLPLLAGSIGAAVAAFFVWLIAGTGGSLFDSSVDQENMLILRDGAWLGLRNALSLAVIALGLLYLWRTLIEPRRDRDRDYWQDYDQSEAYPTDPN